MSASAGCSPAGHSSGLGPGMSMFRWLEVLEKEFDKAFVDVDLLLGEIDPDQVDITYEGRQKMTSLSSCFAQLCHKTQTVFQLNHKLEAQLVDLRSELTEVHDQLLQLHTLQLQLHAKRGQAEDSDTIKVRLPAPTFEEMEQELGASKKEKIVEARLETEMRLYKKENEALRRHMAVLQAEVYGARLAAKYLDKELAGRVQQIQLLGRDMKGPAHDKLWNQLEAEIHLHRHKTVIRACRGRDPKKPLPSPLGHHQDLLKKTQGVVAVASTPHHRVSPRRCSSYMSLSARTDRSRWFTWLRRWTAAMRRGYEDDSGHRYRLYLDELEDSSTAPTSNSSASLHGMNGRQTVFIQAENRDTGISSETASEETPSKPPETDCSL
uniref:Golgi-associated PDZ and coiled-coil motif-containing protein n=1 Tax=Scophthalmus maximus TaxID=52904 RepID=A0A8D3B6T2_SCOMX